MTVDREAFRELRRSGIGGSDVAPILGLSKWKTPLHVYLDKRDLVEGADSARMEMGRYLEPSILQWYLDSQGVSRLNRDTFARHPDFAFLLGNFDMEVANEHGDEWIVDSKNVHWKLASEWGEEGSDEIPLDALFQGHHYLFLRPAAAKVDFVPLLGGAWPPRICTVRRDDELYRDLVLPKLISFWQDHVVPGIPPEPDFADEKTLEAIKTLYPPKAEASEPVPLETSVEIAERDVSTLELMEAFDLLGKIAKEAETRRKRVDAALRYALGDDRSGVIDDAKLTRIYNKGGMRPATTVAPYDYLKVTFPKHYEMKITERRIATLLEGELS